MADRAQYLKAERVVPEADRLHPGAPTLEWVAWLMDRALRVPGTNVRVGLDALLGLLPVGGDVLTGFVQAALVLVAVAHYRVPKAVAARMVANVLLDVGVGSIPVVGDLFDVAFKANTRNMKLLREAREHTARGEAQPAGPSVRYLVGLGAILGAALVLVLGAFIWLVVWATNHRF
ncbi:MAG TPA: DUF4112 domain-containing protein [Isosphaeraceae bacterium]|jgi:hypothetical protein|nr:DUF4112 domain-containing protein [Isosphaeraceae bacterium]